MIGLAGRTFGEPLDKGNGGGLGDTSPQWGEVDRKAAG